MAKSDETVALENALDALCETRREYGCREVTIGFQSKGHGDEIVDYLSMDSQEIFRCFELKISLSDLKSENKKSWYGDYNYLVAGESLYKRVEDWDEFIPSWTGILVGVDLVVKRRAKKRTNADHAMLKDSLLRSVYWKMCQYRQSADTRTLSLLKKEIDQLREEKEEQRLKSDRTIWTASDLESYYRLNHQEPSFTIDEFAKRQRREYALRRENQLVWKRQNERLICPVCGKEGKEEYSYCPYCGSDLRKL